MKTMISLVGFLVLANTACGMSPLANHTVPNRNVDTASVSNESTATCDLYFQTQDLCAKMIWSKEPTRSDEGAFKLYFFARSEVGSQAPTLSEPSAASVFVKLWMTTMGHGSQKVITSHTANGTYDANEVFFVMGGNWDIIVQLKDAAGTVTDSAKVTYNAR